MSKVHTFTIIFLVAKSFSECLLPSLLTRIGYRLFLPGIFSEYFVAQQEDIFKAPEHLTDAEAAALPLAGLTAYRAVFTKGQVSKGQNVLITGIGTPVFLYSLA